MKTIKIKKLIEVYIHIFSNTFYISFSRHVENTPSIEFSRLLFIRIREVAEYGKLFSPLNQGNRRGIRLLDCHYNELTRVRGK